MNANQSVKMKIKTGDTVVIISGGDKGKTGKVLSVHPRTQEVTVEGINIVTKHVKPTRENPRGEIKKITQPIHAGKVAIPHPTEKGRTSRIAYEVKNGTKVRVYRQAGNKEVK